MADISNNLPPLMTLDQYGGDWTTYIEEVYRCFQRDFVLNTVYFEGKRIALKRHPEFKDKEFVFLASNF